MSQRPEPAKPAFDPFDPSHYRDPYARLNRLRRECPVARIEHVGWFLADDAHCRAALRDYERLSNEGNFVLEGEFTDEEPPNIVQLDPPRHSRMRRLLLSAFMPDAVTQLEPVIEQATDELIRAFAQDGHADLVAGLAVPLPLAVLVQLLGIPADDAARLKAWTAEITANLPDGFRELDSWPHFKQYLQAQIEARRDVSDAPDDLVTRLVHASIDGEQLGDAEIRMSVFQLIVAGYESTTHLISNCVYELLAGGHWARIVADPTLVANAVEESLRHDAPIEWVMRSVRTHHEFDGTPLHEGERVLVGLSAANRDPQRWAEAESFIPERPDADKHLAFGYGIHLCLGATLARAEARIGITQLARAFPNLALAPGASFERVVSPMLRGPARLDVHWT
jgi:cytochrome P450